MVHSFLLIGQSNAAGRGIISEACPLDTRGGKIKVLRNGLWIGMYRPVNPDRPFSGTCLAESFAKAYVDANPNVDVGIIPCSDGGTSIKQWQPGEILFENAINCAKLAMRTSKLCGVLWHQGEADCNEEGCDNYYQNFVNLFDSLRKELQITDLPVIVGGLGDFLSKYSPGSDLSTFYLSMNKNLQRIGNEYFNCSFASAEGLVANNDNLHFSAASLEKFGVRYFHEYERLVGVIADDIECGICDGAERSKLELL